MDLRELEAVVFQKKEKKKIRHVDVKHLKPVSKEHLKQKYVVLTERQRRIADALGFCGNSLCGSLSEVFEKYVKFTHLEKDIPSDGLAMLCKFILYLDQLEDPFELLERLKKVLEVE